MPELPEVETTRRGIVRHLQDKCALGAVVRNGSLRWPVPGNLSQLLMGRRLVAINRRAKYLLLTFDRGILIVHLGMSGSLRVLTENTEPDKHEHIDLLFDDGVLLRYRDPRRFGAMLWYEGEIKDHPLLCRLGPEPLSAAFTPAQLQQVLASRKVSIKQAIMDQRVVVGVGNIYASEVLFRARILPQRIARDLDGAEIIRIHASIQTVLDEAIAAGGSTLRDYVNSEGQVGYFTINNFVYGRAGMACRVCENLILSMRQGQRSSFWCPHCQQ